MKIDLRNLADTVTAVEEFSEKTKKLLSIFFLSVSFFISLASYSHQGWISEKHTNIRPDFISTVLSFGLVAPLYARGILKWSTSIYGLLTFILFLFIFASLLKIGLGNSNSEVPKYLISSAVLISWIGISGIAGIAWILAIAAAAFNTVSANAGLGIWGSVFLCSVTLGLLMHSNLSPANLMSSLQNEFSPRLKENSTHIRRNVKDLIEK